MWNKFYSLTCLQLDSLTYEYSSSRNESLENEEKKDREGGRQGNNSFWPLAVLWLKKEFQIKEKYASE